MSYLDKYFKNDKNKKEEKAPSAPVQSNSYLDKYFPTTTKPVTQKTVAPPKVITASASAKLEAKNPLLEDEAYVTAREQEKEYVNPLDIKTGNKVVDTLNSMTKKVQDFNKNPIVSKFTSLGAGANALTWNKNVSEFFYGKEGANQLEEIKQANPNTAFVGEMIGSIAPMAKTARLVGKISKLKNIGNKFGKTAAIEGTAGLGYGTVEGLYRGESLEDAAKRGALYGAGGAILGQLGNLGRYALPTAGGLAGAGIGGYVEGKQALERGESLSDNAGKIINNALVGGLAGVAGGAGLYLASKPVGKAFNDYLDKATTKNVSKSIDDAMAKYAKDKVFTKPTTNILPPPTNFATNAISRFSNAKTDATESVLRPSNIESNINSRPINKNASESIVQPNRPIEANAVWKNQDFDQPVTVIGEAGVMNGKKYYKIQESNSAIPEDELIFNNAEQINKTKQSPIEEPIQQPTEVKQPTKQINEIKTVDDLPKDEQGLTEYVNTVQSKLDSGELKLLDINLNLFGEAKKRLTKISKFRTNTVERQTMTDRETVAELDEKIFEFEPEKVADWERNAVNNVTNDIDKVMNEIKNSKSISGGVQAHEGAAVAKELYNEYKATGSIAKFKEWMKVLAEKTREASRALKGTDTAWDKSSPEAAVIKAQRVTDKAEETFIKSNSNQAKNYKEEQNSASKTSKKVREETSKAIDSMVDEVVEKAYGKGKNTGKGNNTGKGKNTGKTETSFPELLKDKIVNYIKPKSKQEESFIKQMINDLFGEAKDSIKGVVKPVKPDKNIQRLANSYKYREYYREIRENAKNLLKKEFSDNPDALKVLDDYFNKGFAPPHSQKLLNDVISKRLTGVNQGTKPVNTAQAKQNISAWVKDWYASGRYKKEDFVNSIIAETGLAGDAANSLRNLLNSRLKEAGKKEKDRLLNLVFEPKQKGAVKKATDKLSELINIGLFENQKFTGKISDALSPVVKQLLREQKINLNELVKKTIAYGQGERAKIIRDVFKNTRVDDKELNKAIDLIHIEFNMLSNEARERIIKSIFKRGNKNDPTPKPIQKTGVKNLEEYTNLGILDNFAQLIGPKIQDNIKRILKERKISFTEIAKMALKDKQEAKAILMRDVFRGADVSDKDMVKLLDVIDDEFGRLTKDTQSKILNSLTKERNVIQKSDLEKLREKINLGVYDDTIDAAIRDKVKEKYGLPTLSDEEVKFIVDTMDSVKGLSKYDERYYEAVGKVRAMINNKQKSSWIDKDAAARYVSMLFSIPSTLTNVGGNAIFFGLEKNLLSNSARKIYDNLLFKSNNYSSGMKTVGDTDYTALGKGWVKGLRQTTRDMLGGRDLKELQGKSIREVIDILSNPINTDFLGATFGDKLDKGRRMAFDNKFLRSLENVTGSGMKLGDLPFQRAYFDDELQAMMKANNVTEPTEDMIATALQVAAERTFKDLNFLSSSMLAVKNFPTTAAKISGKKGIEAVAVPAQMLMNTQIPFAMTPANLAKRGIEYSPLGLVEGLAKLRANKGNMSMMKQREIVDRLTRGTIGTGLLGLGALGYGAGAITGARDSSKSVQDLKEQEGILSDALKVGNKTYDMKKFQPATTPIIAGARIAQGDGKDALTTALDSAVGVSNLYTDTGLLQNLSDLSQLLGSSEYSNTDKTQTLLRILTSVPRQYIPAIIRQFGASQDEYERNFKDENSAQYALNRVFGKLPGVNTEFPAKVDVYGNPIKSYGGDNSILNTMVNPVKSKELQNNPVTNEVLRLNKALKDKELKTAVIPKEVPETIGERQLTIEERNQYQKIRGDKFLEKANSLLRNPEYAKASEEDKGKLFQKALSESLEVAKKEMQKKLDINVKQLKREQQQDKKYDEKLYKRFGILNKK